MSVTVVTWIVFWLAAGLAIAGAALYDAVAYLCGAPTLSVHILTAVRDNPVVAMLPVIVVVFLFGVLLGHLFWPQP